jgi:hypothetical protein
MGITAKWTAKCDGCDTVKEKEFSVERAETEFSLGTVMDEEICLKWIHGQGKVFHSKGCCYDWLISKGRSSEAEEFKQTWEKE